MFHKLLLVLMFCLCTLSCMVSYAASIEFVTEELAPFQMLDKDGVQTGIAIDIVNELIKEAQINGKITFYPWARAYSLAKTKKNTFIFSILKSEDRIPQFNWIGKIANIQAFLVARSNSTVPQLTSIKQALKYNMSTVRDSLADNYLVEKGFVENTNLYLTATFDNMWQTLFANHVDIVISNNALYRTQIAEAGFSIDDVKIILPLKDFSKEMYLAANLSTDKKLLAKINKAFSTIRADGRYDAIMTKWGLHLPIR